MEKYNKVVEYYKSGMDGAYAFKDEQEVILKKAYDSAAKAIDDKLQQFYTGLEETVKDWTTNDYDDFINIACHDNRVDSETLLTISAAYAKTHQTDKDRVHNAATKAAMNDVTMRKVNGVLDEALDRLNGIR